MSVIRMNTIAVVAALFVAHVAAGTMTWTGIMNNNQWETANNWHPAQVPGANDDVVIPKGTVQLTAATSVQSLNMGGQFSAAANLTLFKAFFVTGKMTVEGNGNLIINTGLDTVSGTVDIAGHLDVVDGILGGEWTVNKMGTVDMSNGNEKTFSGASFVSQGAVSMGGVIVLNQSSTIQIESTLVASGNLLLQAQDKTKVLFDASKATSFTYGKGLMSIQCPTKIGKFTLVSGNVTAFHSMSFTEELAIPAKSFVSAIGAVSVVIAKGVTGAGFFLSQCNEVQAAAVTMSGNVAVLAGSFIITTKSKMSGIMTIKGGALVAEAALQVGMLNLLSGSVSGTATVAAGKAYMMTKGFNLNSAVAIIDSMLFDKSLIAFGQQGKLTIQANASALVQGTLQLTGAPFVEGFVNAGTVGLKADLSSNVNIRGTGAIKAMTDAAITVTSALVEQGEIGLGADGSFSGATTMLKIGSVSAAKTVTAVIGDYTLQCAHACDHVATPSAKAAPIVKFTFTA